MPRLYTIAGRPVSERPYETTHRTERMSFLVLVAPLVLGAAIAALTWFVVVLVFSLV